MYFGQNSFENLFFVFNSDIYYAMEIYLRKIFFLISKKLFMIRYLFCFFYFFIIPERLNNPFFFGLGYWEQPSHSTRILLIKKNNSFKKKIIDLSNPVQCQSDSITGLCKNEDRLG